MVNIEPDDKVKAFINVISLTDTDYLKNNFIVLCTRKGVIKKTNLEAFSRPRQNGIVAINVKEGDTLLEAKLTNGSNDIIMAVRSGKAIRFNEGNVRPMGRTASGVRGVTLAGPHDEVIGMVCIDDSKPSLLVVSEKGYGKRSEVDDYRIVKRGGKGVKTLNVTEKTGKLIAINAVVDEDNLMIITKNGITIRLDVSGLRVMGRATQGVRLIKMRGNDKIAAVARVPASEDEEEINDQAPETGEGTTIETEE
jgi:DNA gyrase subunit A